MASYPSRKTFRNHAEEISYHQQMHKAYTDGRKAGASGADTAACPYRSGSELFDEWFKGYADGQAMIMQLPLTEDQARILRRMVIQHLELVQGDGSLSDEDDDILAELNLLIREKTEGI